MQCFHEAEEKMSGYVRRFSCFGWENLQRKTQQQKTDKRDLEENKGIINNPLTVLG